MHDFSPDDPVLDDPFEIDTSVAHPARRYNYWLGGKDNFEADRISGDEGLAIFPTAKIAAMENRRFLRRAVTFLVKEAGVRQFLDIGTGIPSADNVHEVAQSIAPEARVVYVDNDPIVLAHARRGHRLHPRRPAPAGSDLGQPRPATNHRPQRTGRADGGGRHALHRRRR